MIPENGACGICFSVSSISVVLLSLPLSSLPLSFAEVFSDLLSILHAQFAACVITWLDDVFKPVPAVTDRGDADPHHDLCLLISLGDGIRSDVTVTSRGIVRLSHLVMLSSDAVANRETVCLMLWSPAGELPANFMAFCH